MEWIICLFLIHSPKGNRAKRDLKNDNQASVDEAEYILMAVWEVVFGRLKNWPEVEVIILFRGYDDGNERDFGRTKKEADF